MNRKLYRSPTEKILGGVCGGVAEYFAIDVTIVRVIWALSFFLHGVGFLAYIICWIVIPVKPDYIDLEPAPDRLPVDRTKTMQFLGILLVVFGALLLLGQYYRTAVFLWPTLLILAGAFIIYKAQKGEA